jgi:5-methylcytosine-specific restriction endonuclease McrA
MIYAESRAQVIERDRCCFLCLLERDEIRPIEEVHHVVPRSRWGRKNPRKHDVKNLVGLCHRCHGAHRPHVQAHTMVVYILAQLRRLYGYEYQEPDYRRWATEIYEEKL